MGELTSWVEGTVETDFCMLSLAPSGWETPDAWIFATSEPGSISMTAGSRHATAVVRAERWSSRPPPVDAIWHERDVLPFENAEGAGPLILSGFDGNYGELDVEDLGRARVEVLARSRQQLWSQDYDGQNGQELEPEEWLLRFWPDQENLDGMAGGPRRIVHRVYRRVRGEYWGDAVLSLRDKGWDEAVFGRSPEYQRLLGELSRSAGPVGIGQLIDAAGFADGLNTTVTDRFPGQPKNVAPEVAQVVTVGDLVETMLDLGLLAVERRLGVERVVPNPGAPRPEDALTLTEEQQRYCRHQRLQDKYREIHYDLLHLLRWAPGMALEVTPFEIAFRLGVTPDEVVGGIDFLISCSDAIHGPNIVSDLKMTELDSHWDDRLFDRKIRLSTVAR